ncbi:hypothetical protein [Thalassococcus sp. S3]|uniref:DUF6925 family protein n=1 Tax=Thalassococcus sp. S3 TaxID=2017482 RepID=UPI001024347A|nr:hypothetical protein [Thalassococcus sp. S3]QBF30193.1 hypothetical protein CFI11_03035 [Thalassococcus sp. S3]
MLDLFQVARGRLDDPETGWNMGSFGAIAEFHHVAGDPPPTVTGDLSRITARGGIRLDTLTDVRPVAFETLSPKPHRWSQAVALCLPEDAALMSRRDNLTELGPDTKALRPEDQGAVLFDMGLAQPQVDFCIRTSDPKLLSVLREAEGKSLFEKGNPAMGAILATHPHRVALTRVGRVEVYQLIGGPDTGGKSPEGPHTHVLPKLLRAERTHSANAPIPEGWVPCASFHPGSPVFDRMGADKDFDAEAFAAFQDLLRLWGIAEYNTAKDAAWAALRAGENAESHREPDTRLGRAALRNAIRQWRRENGDASLVRAWAERFDRSTHETEDDNPGH